MCSRHVLYPFFNGYLPLFVGPSPSMGFTRVYIEIIDDFFHFFVSSPVILWLFIADYEKFF